MITYIKFYKKIKNFREFKIRQAMIIKQKFYPFNILPYPTKINLINGFLILNFLNKIKRKHKKWIILCKK